MDANILQKLGLNSTLNSKDLDLLNQILNSSLADKNNMPKLSVREKNNLINKLTSTITTKNLQNMDLKNPNNLTEIMKNMDLKNPNNQLLNNLTETMKNLDPKCFNEQLKGFENINSSKSTNLNQVETTPRINNLDKIKELVEQKYENNQHNLDKNLDDNFEDYMK